MKKFVLAAALLASAAPTYCLADEFEVSGIIHQIHSGNGGRVCFTLEADPDTWYVLDNSQAFDALEKALSAWNGASVLPRVPSRDGPAIALDNAFSHGQTVFFTANPDAPLTCNTIEGPAIRDVDRIRKAK